MEDENNKEEQATPEELAELRRHVAELEALETERNNRNNRMPKPNGEVRSV